MFENLRADLRRAREINVGPERSALLKLLLQPTTIAVVTYRFGHWVTKCRIPVVRQVLAVVAMFSRCFVQVLTGVNICPDAKIGPGFVIHTPYGVFVGPTKIGRNCVVQHGVVISYGTRRIGDNVFFGPGAKVIGNANIGSNVVVVANSVVITDVPDNTTVAGVPARMRLPRGKTLMHGEGSVSPNGNRRRVFKEKLAEWRRLDEEEQE
jgi:serine O-acetyltransferase